MMNVFFVWKVKFCLLCDADEDFYNKKLQKKTFGEDSFCKKINT